MIMARTDKNQIQADCKAGDILDRLRAGEPIRLDDAEYGVINSIVASTIRLSAALNASTDVDQVRELLGEIIGSKLDHTTTVFPPFHTNFGRFTAIGKHVFINHACSFLDMGGITIEDHVLIGPRVNLVTENHPLEPSDRRALITKPILIKRNAWIGAAAVILPGVTIGENAVVAAGAVVSKDVPANTVVGGIPAKIIKAVEAMIK
jgi:acetyltransferase-like isoleucine patch superfamily enzyme